MKNTMTTAILITAALALGACGHSHGDGEPGTIAITVYGEDFIEEGIPAAEVTDGWAISFDKFLISIGDFEVGHGHETPEVVFEDAKFQVFDLAKSSGGKGFTLGMTEVDGGHYDHYKYRVSPAADAAAGNADQADIDALKAGNYAVLIQGSATKDTVTKTFEWGFTTGTLYNHCHSEATVDGNTATVEFTIHGDHLFYDSLVSAEPDLTFDVIAGADTDADDVITQTELVAVDITGLPNYDTGSEDIDNLGDYIARQVSTLGHIDGEGHCGVQMPEN